MSVLSIFSNMLQIGKALIYRLIYYIYVFDFENETNHSNSLGIWNRISGRNGDLNCSLFVAKLQPDTSEYRFLAIYQELWVYIQFFFNRVFIFLLSFHQENQGFGSNYPLSDI